MVIVADTNFDRRFLSEQNPGANAFAQSHSMRHAWTVENRMSRVALSESAGVAAVCHSGLIPDDRGKLVDFWFWIDEKNDTVIGMQLRAQIVIISSLLLIQSVLLAYSASTHSPTYLEPAFLSSGLSHLEFGRFELYRVNPPFPRAIAALPIEFVDHKSDWSSFHDSPGARTEFSIGNSFFRANGLKTITLIMYGRWACIPFSLIGAVYAYRWAKDLYGPKAAVCAMAMFAFEPNLLAHGELITPDMACTAFGMCASYHYWKWLRSPTWTGALVAGIGLGFAELSKMTWLLLYGLWPLIWFVWRLTERFPKRFSRSQQLAAGEPKPQAVVNSNDDKVEVASIWQLLFILVFSVYLLNLGYVFEGTGTQLKSFDFVSHSLTNSSTPGVAGNRFRNTILGELPIPLPRQYVLGFDLQKKDFEKFSYPSFLRGEWRERGWWYYYLYGMLVKIPCGVWAILCIAVCTSCRHKHSRTNVRDELVLLAVIFALLALVSSQSAFSIHFRYVLPVIGLLMIYISKVAECIRPSRPIRSTLILSLYLWAIGASILQYPHELRYFNEFVGGSKHGHKHVLGSSFDWGQDLQQDLVWAKKNYPDADLDFRMQFQEFGKVLLSEFLKEESQTRSKPARKLTLISADYLSQLQVRYATKSNETEARETFRLIHAFPSGSALIEFEQPRRP